MAKATKSTLKKGILMPISSLPSAYGIGNLGKQAYAFADFLEATGQDRWQVLPLNPTAFGDSPYQSPCSFAGNPYFIDPDTLAEKGLLTAAELKKATRKAKKVDYGWLWTTRFDLLRLAYSRFEPDAAFKHFCRAQSAWLEDYALFMALKKENSYRSFVEWEEQHRSYQSAQALKTDFADEMGFWKWVQFEFYTEWSALRAYVNKKGIKIIGDIPIYVAYDSVEVWSHPESFLLDPQLKPLLVAGCPPDPYAAEGQLWGNPIYDWEKMEKEGFPWWIDRIGGALKLYDTIRIDHFRGFAGYYVIPYGDKTAENGWWEPAPGKALFDAVKASLPFADIIAEDLGTITDDVRELLAYTGFPGMKVMQFAFYCDDDDSLPRTFKSGNVIVYSGSHDAPCTASWCKTLEGEDLARFKKECLKPYGKDKTKTEAVISLAMASIAGLCMIPMQDYLELTDKQGRMNVPSTAQGNWCWRLHEGYDTPELREKIIRLSSLR